MSQETLAEKVDISTAHMSHIETANTKLSLPVFIAICEVLEVPADMLLYDESPATISIAMQEISNVLEACSTNQARAIADIVKAAKQSFDAYF